MDKDVGPQREKMLMDLDKFAKTASDMINNRSMNITFDDVINIRDRYKVNTFLQRRQRENPDMDYSVLNSVFVDHMFARTDNPTDSSISNKYIERIHEAAYILQKMSKSIENEKKNQYSPASKPDLQSVQMRIDNLIELINAEKFDFEDVEAWRMGAIMENMFKDHWRIRSNELAQLRIQISERIQAGDIVTEGGVDEIIRENRDQIIHEETTAIKAINDSELEPYFKNRLIDQLRDQVENVSRDYRITLQNEFLKHKHNIAKEEGKFSDRELQSKIMEGINNMEVAENLSQYEMDRRFQHFWNSEDVINSPELKTLQKNIQSTSFEQQVNYRRYVKDGVQFALESLNYEISVRTLFPDMDSIYNWNFTTTDLQSIKVMDDPDYFEDRTQRQYGSTSQYNTRSNSKFQYVHRVGTREISSDSPYGYYDDYGRWKSSKGKSQWQVQGKVNSKNQHNQVSTQNTVVTPHTGSLFDNVKQGVKNFFSSNSGNQNETTATGKYATFMIELYSKFDKSIDDNPQTQRNFDGTVDEPVIRDLCMGFKGSIEELAAKYKIKNFLKPHFIVICVVFASFKMLLPRLIQNSDQSSKKSDPVKQLDKKKDNYKKLFILKLRGAQKSEIWRQQIVHRLKEAIAQIYLQIDGSQATHHEVYEMIKTFANNDKNNRFPSIETYRKFRFCMYMEIMNDAQSGQDKVAVFRKWQRICNYDMEPCEKDFIRSGFSFDLIAESIAITCWSTYETREINFETCEKKFPASTFCRTKWRVQRSSCKFH